ncbi:hypothetical protein ACWM35_12550 [Neobacillus sp. K501]
MEITRIVTTFKLQNLEGSRNILIDNLKSLFEVQKFYSDQLITLLENSEKSIKVILKGSGNIDFDIKDLDSFDLIKNFTANPLFNDFSPELSSVRFSFKPIHYKDGFNMLFRSDLHEDVKTEMLGFKIQLDHYYFYVSAMNKNQRLNLSINIKNNNDIPINIGEDMQFIMHLLMEKVIPKVSKIIGLEEN